MKIGGEFQAARKAPPVSIDYEAGWAPEQVCAFHGREKFLSFSWNRTAIPRL
jgi:hypothetical protein